MANSNQVQGTPVVTNVASDISELVVITSSSNRFRPFATIDSGVISKKLNTALSAVTGAKVYGSGTSVNDPELIAQLMSKGVRVAVSK